MFQVRFRLRDDCGNSFHALAQIRNALLGRREIARDQQIEAVGQTLIVDQRVPFPFLQFFDVENFVVDIVLQHAKIDSVCAGQLRKLAECFKLLPRLPWRVPVPERAFPRSNQ